MAIQLYQRLSNHTTAKKKKKQVTPALASDLDTFLYRTGFTESSTKGAGLRISLSHKEWDF